MHPRNNSDRCNKYEINFHPYHHSAAYYIIYCNQNNISDVLYIVSHFHFNHHLNASIHIFSGSWNNAPVVSFTFESVKGAGFKSVRIPVTYAYHFTGTSPDWTIDPDWLQRVSDVVDMVTDLGLYAIVNAHHGKPIFMTITHGLR
ncbi:hypothetical protein N7454_006848 [Penicillium verhagenii]|nr:hypothetical protein N7454_006848 [Penicillium verhagenii]